MLPLRVDQDFLNLLGVVATYGAFKQEQLTTDSRKTMELVKERYVVDITLAGGAWFPRWEGVFGRVGDYDKAIALLWEELVSSFQEWDGRLTGIIAFHA